MTAVLIPTADEAAWLEARRAGVTASEIAVVMGLSPWSSPYALYHRKAGTLPEPEDDISKALGRELEGFIARQFAERRPEFYVEGNGLALYSHPERHWQMATPDRILTEQAAQTDWQGFLDAEDVAVLECKTSAAYDGWGEDGTDEISVHYRCQVLWQMDVMGTDAGFVACLFLHSRQMRVYELAMDDQARADLELMREHAELFLTRLPNDHFGGHPPDVDWRPATGDALKRLHPDLEDRDVPVKRMPIIQYQAACRAYRAAERRKKAAENRLRQMLGNGRRVTSIHTGEVIATRQVYDLPAKTIERSACTVDKLIPAKERT